MRSVIALDANASVPPVAEAIAALTSAVTTSGGWNPSSPHSMGRKARRLIDVARDHVAAMMGASAKEVFFTSGATEGNRFVVDTLIELGRSKGRPIVVVTSPLEHPSLHKGLHRASERGLIILRTLPIVGGSIAADVDVIAGADAVTVTGAHNETGIVTDLDAIVAVTDSDTALVVDAAQLVGRRPPVTARADIVVASAHKCGGVVGAGAIVVRGRARAWPLPWVAGGQEQGVRPGTENTPAIAAFGAAAAVVDDTRRAHMALRALRDHLEGAVVAAGARVIGTGDGSGDRLENTSAFFVADVDPEALRLSLDQARVAVGFGAACSALAPEPSPSLMALGLSAADTRRVVRVSLSPQSTAGDVNDGAARIVDVIRHLR
jgi:cysteine desulfurase